MSSVNSVASGSSSFGGPQAAFGPHSQGAMHQKKIKLETQQQEQLHEHQRQHQHQHQMQPQDIR